MAKLETKINVLNLPEVKAELKLLRELLREGADGFGRILIATSDDKAVRDWQKRVRAALTANV